MSDFDRWEALRKALERYARECDDADSPTSAQALRDIAAYAQWHGTIIHAAQEVLKGHTQPDPGPPPTPAIPWTETATMLATMADRASYYVHHHRNHLARHIAGHEPAEPDHIDELDRLLTTARRMQRDLSSAVELAVFAGRP